MKFPAESYEAFVLCCSLPLSSSKDESNDSDDDVTLPSDRFERFRSHFLKETCAWREIHFLYFDWSSERAGGDVALDRDSTAKAFYELIAELFQIKGVFKWFRKTFITFVKVTFGRSVNRCLCHSHVYHVHIKIVISDILLCLDVFLHLQTAAQSHSVDILGRNARLLLAPVSRFVLAGRRSCASTRSTLATRKKDSETADQTETVVEHSR